MNDNYITLTIGKKKNIALIAHDNKKADLIEWCEQNKDNSEGNIRIILLKYITIGFQIL